MNPNLASENPNSLWRKLKTPILKFIITFSTHIAVDNVICVRLTKSPPFPSLIHSTCSLSSPLETWPGLGTLHVKSLNQRQWFENLVFSSFIGFTPADKGRVGKKKAYYHFAPIAHALSSKQQQKAYHRRWSLWVQGRLFSPIIHSNTPLILRCSLQSLHSVHRPRCHSLWHKRIDPFKLKHRCCNSKVTNRGA